METTERIARDAMYIIALQEMIQEYIDVSIQLGRTEGIEDIVNNLNHNLSVVNENISKGLLTEIQITSETIKCYSLTINELEKL